MTWAAWRLSRAQTVLAAALLAAVLVVLTVTHGNVVRAPDPGSLPAAYQWTRLLGTGLIGVPAFLGAFWGSPILAREYEARTNLFAWTQGVSRSRWLLVRVAVIVLAAVALVGLFSAAFTWWSLAFDRTGNRIGTANFGQRGTAPVGYTVFAIALGLTFGALTRRTLVAMSATLATFMVVRIAFQALVRPHLAATATASRPTQLFGTTGSGSSAVGGWVHSSRLVDAAGRAVDWRVAERAITRCAGSPRATRDVLEGCSRRLGFQDLVTFHPASSFWQMQLLETSAFVLAGAALVAFCVWWVRNH